MLPGLPGFLFITFSFFFLFLSVLQEKEVCPGDLVDTDCTWVSHSLLQRRGENSSVATGFPRETNSTNDTGVVEMDLYMMIIFNIWCDLFLTIVVVSSFCFEGLCKKANNSLDMMFDTTAYEEYKSYSSSRIQADDEEEEDKEDYDHGRTVAY